MNASLVCRLWTKRSFEESYPSIAAAIGEGVGLLLSLWVYFYTAKAFAPAVPDLVGQDYFTYLVMGEALLVLPFALTVAPLRFLKTAMVERTWEEFLLNPAGLFRVVSVASLACLPREFLRVLILLAVATFGFGLKISAPGLCGALVLLLLVSPLFLAIGLLGAAIFLRFRRGGSLMSYLQSGAAVLAGAYFPVSVFPEWLSRFSRIASPYTVLLETLRAWSRGLFEMGPLLALSAWSLALFGLALFVFPRAVHWHRMRGDFGSAMGLF